MNIRSTAAQWYLEYYGAKPKYFRSSKYYEGFESWSKTPCWWFNLPLQFLEEKLESHAVFVGEISSDHHNKFFVLKIPIDYFLEHINELALLADKNINLMLSAESHNFLKDIKGGSQVDFSQFLISER